MISIGSDPGGGSSSVTVMFPSSPSKSSISSLFESLFNCSGQNGDSLLDRLARESQLVKLNAGERTPFTGFEFETAEL